MSLSTVEMRSPLTGEKDGRSCLLVDRRDRCLLLRIWGGNGCPVLWIWGGRIGRHAPRWYDKESFSMYKLSGSYLVEASGAGCLSWRKKRVDFLRTSWFGWTVCPDEAIVPAKTRWYQSLVIQSYLVTCPSIPWQYQNSWKLLTPAVTPLQIISTIPTHVRSINHQPPR